VTATLLAVLLAGSLVQSVVAAASVWMARAPASGDAVASLQEWSRRGNVLVLVLDSLQSDVFEDVLEAEPRLRDELDGFRHYRLASSNGPTTYLSLPTIHGGRPYEPGRSVVQFYREAVYEGSVLNRLASAGYRTSYAVGIGDCPKSVAICTSSASLARSRVEWSSPRPHRSSTSVSPRASRRLREAVLRTAAARSPGPVAGTSPSGPWARRPPSSGSPRPRPRPTLLRRPRSSTP
jgi:hypothetical protein